MSSLHTLERRLAAVEARLADVESAHERTLYRLERRTVRTELWLGRIAERLGGITPPTDDDIDAALDEGS